MNLLDYPSEQLARPIVGRTILLRLEIWTGRNWAIARHAGLICGPFGSVAWGEAMRTVNALRLGLLPQRRLTRRAPSGQCLACDTGDRVEVHPETKQRVHWSGNRRDYLVCGYERKRL